jgi:diaminohydroxyphosphoribosylaminopyrimidine deaminase / 5-amino-6-(5-phosphoribosylamino)uracil reductase
MKVNDFLSKCYDLAKSGIGYVSPNPLVGAVIVVDKQIIAEGYHAKHGDIHAEIVALNKVRNMKLSKATLYCSLEPCSHKNNSKINLPCTDEIISSGIKKVVIGMIDPNPEVCGRGIKKLIENGVDVIISEQNERFLYQNRFFVKNMKENTPFVTVKLATSLDGKIASSTGHSQWITSEALRKIVHEYRHEHDAVLIGSGTAEKDNPELTVRHISGKQPWRVVIDSNLKLDENLKLFTDFHKEKTILICDPMVNKVKIKRMKDSGIQIIEINKSDNHIPLKNILISLYKYGIRSVLIEAGQSLATALVNEKLVDELILMISNKLIGTGKPAFLNLNVDNVNEAPTLNVKSLTQIENEFIIKGSLCSQV